LSDIQFYWQASSNLLDWKTVTADQETSADGRDPTLERRQAFFSRSGSTRFFKLVVRQVTPNP
jgi:hypothetical protein